MTSQQPNEPQTSSGAQPRSGSRSSWKGIVLGLALAAVAIGVVMKIRASRLPTMTRTELQAAKTLWDERRPANYDITVKVTGMQPGIYEVSVENGLAVAATFDGRQLKRQRTFGTWAVTGMFDTLARDLETNENANYLMLGAQFDPDFGFPTRYQRIEMRTGAHDALQWQVTRFEPHR